MGYRVEHDTMGDIQVEDSRYWGSQTQRSLENFPIGGERFSEDFIQAYGLLKKACVLANARSVSWKEEKLKALLSACDEVISGKLKDHFPLVVWQTGSGTQTNMNLNEVIANRAAELLGGKKGQKELVHPNDDVNRSQSSNDTFPAAMHIAAVSMVSSRLLPAAELLASELEAKARVWAKVIKVGRTHLQDAVPLSLGQEFSAYVTQLRQAVQRISFAAEELLELPIGGTAVGTGLNAPPGFDAAVCEELSKLSGDRYTPAANKFALLAAHDGIAGLSGALSTLAAALMKISNDIRWLGSGPRCGIGELILPENEPGSSIMPGKVNPTQSEALTMICAQVMGNHSTIAFACSQGNFELNVFKPVIIHNLLQSISLLADGMESFRLRCVAGLEPNREKLAEYLERTLMVATALNPHIGYDKAAAIAKKAHAENITLKEAGIRLGFVTGEEYDSWVVPEKMV
ncbi:class II fumarate hydratase [Marispirochaeta sp.]|uniref:class II fumarate hydratase n=1 Tax=Marispirochaeta sp. TaxID=2038653 RepID=UPI0029C72E98|nr:class II fumarate hydratase [Marispirochaeta sp.]